jgi:hypothetical protein
MATVFDYDVDVNTVLEPGRWDAGPSPEEPGCHLFLS